MLTSSEKNLLPSMLQRTFACHFLDLIKMRSLVPAEVEDELTGYKTKIVEMVFDPKQMTEVNGRFQAEGYLIPENTNVIAVNDDETILVWGSLNSVLWLRRGKAIGKAWETNLAFQDLRDLTGQFKIKNKKIEIERMIAELKAFAKKQKN